MPPMIEQGEEGHIVNTASVGGVLSGTGVYSVTKHGVVALTEALFYDLERIDSKLHCSVLCPGVTRPTSSTRTATVPTTC